MFNIHEIYLNGGKGPVGARIAGGRYWLEQLKGEGFILTCNAKLCPSWLESHDNGSWRELVILCPQLGNRAKVLA